MNQGRLPPVGPPQTPQDESSPAPAPIDDRVARKVETLRHVLRLERDQNHANHAVIGGLDAFLERWIEDPAIKRVLDDASGTLPNYEGLTQEQRAAWVRETIERLTDPGQEPSPPAADVERAPVSAPTASPAASPPPPMDVPPDPAWDRIEQAAPRQSNRPAPSPAERVAPTQTKKRPTPRPTPTVTPVTSLDEPLDAPSRMKAGLKKLGIETYRNALWAFPRRYVPVSPIARLISGEQAAISVRVEKQSGGNFTARRQVMRIEATVSDATGQVAAVWFGNPWVTNMLKRGSRLLLTGRLGEYRNRAQFHVETYEQLRAEDKIDTGELVPIYPLTKGVTQSGMRRLIGPAAERALTLVEEFLPDDVIREARLPGLREALGLIHRPADLSDDERARRRLAFEGAFLAATGIAGASEATAARIGRADSSQ